ncbi:hypothetical protein BO70DRAFT_171993 [Aspergillus heteromorphus CBS 117.55]|uniref:Uncharacterized protein n=1 Tax=Aspergillus heteromorphus CBS 117.55 TaxID=1448321 RepID=A0A317V1U8_9EURO|nr:uncharacterized protein BO70DRAFT_171993 [Aspergillus heteromorphus CBS 117.55]PWY66767.1 hypothetical protein BO70DRAFT_171993 [Aspergillus heteromorphus CBS 117.55]
MGPRTSDPVNNRKIIRLGSKVGHLSRYYCRAIHLVSGPWIGGQCSLRGVQPPGMRTLVLRTRIRNASLVRATDKNQSCSIPKAGLDGGPTSKIARPRAWASYFAGKTTTEVLPANWRRGAWDDSISDFAGYFEASTGHHHLANPILARGAEP